MSKHQQTDVSDVRFALAPSYGAGARGEFTDGPFETVTAELMGMDGLIFQVDGRQPPMIALDAVLPVADHMSEAMYRRLQSALESMDHAAAQGKDVHAGFEGRRRVVEALMEASPWTLHPDDGLIREFEIYNGEDERAEAHHVQQMRDRADQFTPPDEICDDDMMYEGPGPSP